MVWRTWWLGDFTGALVIVPLAIAWSRPPRMLLRTRGLEGGALVAVLVVLSAIATSTHDPLLYLLFPPLIWAALRFGTHGATLGVAVVAGFTVWNTSNFDGPFVFSDVSANVVSTQLFIAVAALTSLCLAAVVAEREEFGRGPARIARPPGRDVGHGAAQDRPQPPRRRPAAAVGPGRPPPARRRRSRRPRTMPRR